MNKLAQDNIFGGVTPPAALEKISPGGDPGGMIILFNNILKLLVIGAGIFFWLVTAS